MPKCRVGIESEEKGSFHSAREKGRIRIETKWGGPHGSLTSTRNLCYSSR